MPRYFFDTYAGSRDNLDESGFELSDNARAQATALELLPTLASETLPAGETRSFIVRVRGEEDGYLLLVTLGLKNIGLA